MAEGLSNDEIAAKMGLRPKSVQNYVNVIYEHLGVSGQSMGALRVRAVLWYLEHVEELTA